MVVLGEWSLVVMLALLILPPLLLDGVDDAMGVGVVATELVTEAVVGVGVDVVDWDSQRPTRFIICGDMPGRFLAAMWRREGERVRERGGGGGEIERKGERERGRGREGGREGGRKREYKRE